MIFTCKKSNNMKNKLIKARIIIFSSNICISQLKFDKFIYIIIL